MSKDKFEKSLEEIIQSFEKMHLADYIEYLKNPKRILWVNFISGVARGFGTAFGFSILGALLIYILNSIVKYNLPIIGKYIAQLLNIIKFYIK
ncbi:DUF5665 domain-containing protein [Caldicellulosiruptoraceae bacterium PP1]